MAVTPAFKEFVLAQLDDLGDVTLKAMFGELGLYHQGIFFAIVADDQLFLRVDDESRKQYEAEGMRPFAPFGPSSRRYYAVPLAVLESGAELLKWARRAVVAAKTTRAPAKTARAARGHAVPSTRTRPRAKER